MRVLEPAGTYFDILCYRFFFFVLLGPTRRAVLLFLISAVPLRDLAPNPQYGMVYDHLTQKGVSEKAVSQDISFEPGGAVHGITEDSKDLIKRPEMILWTKGNEIYMVESTSFKHALIFEKKLAKHLEKVSIQFAGRRIVLGFKRCIGFVVTGGRIILHIPLAYRLIRQSSVDLSEPLGRSWPYPNMSDEW